MDEQTHKPTQYNPLTRHFRQPAIFLKLPSNGAHWPTDAIELPISGEIPILPMSTKDEITLRTPDALMNGQGVVSVIESCCPSIKNAWDMPSIDIDAVIIAIRIASYGNEMDFTTTCPSCGESHEYTIDLSYVLSTVKAPSYSRKVAVEDLKIKLKPQAYFSLNKANMIAFEEQQIVRQLAQVEDHPETAREVFDRQLEKIIDMNVEALAGSTDYIELPDGSIVQETDYISEFYRNCDSKVVKAIKDQIAEYAIEGGLQPVQVNCYGCDAEIKVAIEFEWASFFGKGS